MKNINLLQYAVKYLSKYNSSKRNLNRILKSKIQKSTWFKCNRYYDEKPIKCEERHAGYSMLKINE